MLSPGTRKGKYRIDSDRLLTDDSGESRISLEDYALTLLNNRDIIKSGSPSRTNQRYTLDPADSSGSASGGPMDRGEVLNQERHHDQPLFLP
jgi:hypothetical protein